MDPPGGNERAAEGIAADTMIIPAAARITKWQARLRLR
jgi:hypothetical protein